MFDIYTVVVTPFSQNARILASAGEAVVIDPGGESDKIIAALQKYGLSCKQIWLTHSHLDHCGGVAALIDKTQAELYAHPVEEEMRQHVEYVAGIYGLPGGIFKDCPEPQHYIKGGETLRLGPCNFKVLFTPGHSPGHVSFYEPEKQLLIAGDTIFCGSIGRSDIPGGDEALLARSIRGLIETLPPETAILSGHGPDTRLEVELRTNPFLKGVENV